MACAGVAKATVEIPVTTAADASLLMVESFMSILRAGVGLFDMTHAARSRVSFHPGDRMAAPCCHGDNHDIGHVVGESLPGPVLTTVGCRVARRARRGPFGCRRDRPGCAAGRRCR